MADRRETRARIEAMSPEQRADLRRRVAARRAADDTVVPLGRTDGESTFPAAPGHERMVVLHELAGSAAGYTLPLRLQLRGDVRPDLLAEALRYLARRHESLRTVYRFDHDRGGLTQVVTPPGDHDVEFEVAEVTGVDSDAVVEAFQRIPFDLTELPMLRARLWRVRDAESPTWLFALVVHHIAVDGWSLGILVRELSTVYSALVGGGSPDLPPLTVGMPEFARWQRDRAAGPAAERQRQFWRETLAGVTRLDLATDHPRPSRPTYAGRLSPLRLGPRVVERLTTLATHSGTTLFVVVAAVFAQVLRRWSGEADVLVGTAVAGRSRPEFDDVVGFMVNTVPLRFDLDTPRTVADLVAGVAATVNVALDNADLPFSEIAELLDAGSGSAVQALLTLNPEPLGLLQLAGAEAELAPLLPSGTELDVSVDLAPTADGALVGWVVGAADLFEQSTTDALRDSLVTALEWCGVDRLDNPVRKVPVLSPEDRRRLLDDLSGVARPAYPTATLPQRFAAACTAAGPSAVALVVDAEPGPSQEVTYAQLLDVADRFGHVMLAAGVHRGDRVGVALHRSVEMVAAILAVGKVGAILVPLDPDHPVDRLTVQLSDSGASLLVAEDGLPPLDVAGLRRIDRAALPDLLAGAPSTSPDVAVSPDAGAYILFTSGSTGRPKGVVLSHAAIGNRMIGMREEMGFDGSDVVLHKSTVNADPALWEIFVPLFTGARCVLARPSLGNDPAYLHGVLGRHGVTACEFIPSLLRPVLARPGFGAAARSVRLVLSAGEVLAPALAIRLLTALPGVALFNCYGPTETTLDITTYRIGMRLPDPVPIGRPVVGSDLYVVDHALDLQPPGAPGELIIGGVQVGDGYHGRPEQTRTAFVPHPFRAGDRVYRTGDRVRWTPDGDLVFLGRIDRQVKVHGYRVEPAEVEQVLRELPDIEDASVLARPGADGSAELHGYVVARPSAVIEPLELRRRLAARLPSAMIPATFTVMPALPLTTSGKVDLRALPEPVVAPAGPSRPPADNLERALVAMWQEALRTSEVDVARSFFDLGGSSLVATIVVSRVREVFDLELPLHFFMESPTIEGMAVLVRREAARSGIDVDRVAELYVQVAAMSDDEVARRLHGD